MTGNITQMMGGQQFDANTVEPSQAMEVMPKHWATVVISESEAKPTAAGGGLLALTFKVQGGQYANRVVWENLNLVNANEKAVEIAQRDLSAICRSIGVMIPDDSSQLHDIPLDVLIDVEKAQIRMDPQTNQPVPDPVTGEPIEDYPAKNKINGYAKAGTKASAAAANTAAPVQQAAVATVATAAPQQAVAQQPVQQATVQQPVVQQPVVQQPVQTEVVQQPVVQQPVVADPNAVAPSAEVVAATTSQPGTVAQTAEVQQQATAQNTSAEAGAPPWAAPQ